MNPRPCICYVDIPWINFCFDFVFLGNIKKPFIGIQFEKVRKFSGVSVKYCIKFTEVRETLSKLFASSITNQEFGPSEVKRISPNRDSRFAYEPHDLIIYKDVLPFLSF